MRRSLRDWLLMAVLSASGGVIYLLPFLQEVFYKSVMEAMQIDNTQVGGLLAAFGVTSMLAYFPGGWLADRVSPRKLLSGSLFISGMLGLTFATFPAYFISVAIHALLGVSVTFLFWGAMIRVTRNWAPSDEQGRAFGLLEMGRGLTEMVCWSAFLALFAVLGASVFALSVVVSTISTLCLLMAVLAWWVIEDDAGGEMGNSKAQKVGWNEVLEVLRLPVVWLIAAVIFSAYCAMYGTIRFTSYVTDIFAMSIAVAGVISVAKMWLKPFAAPIAGFVADRLGVARTCATLLAVLVASFLVFSILPGSASFIPLMLFNVAIVSIAVAALRGIYFALIEEGGVPLRVTGTAAGVISVVAYTPDIFMPLLGGHLLDNYPGGAGYRYFFLISAAICTAGATAAWLILRNFSTSRQKPAADLP